MLPQGNQVCFRVVGRGEHGLLLSHTRGIGSHLESRGESRGVSLVVAGRFGFISSCNWNLREPLMLPLGSQPSFQVARGT